MQHLVFPAFLILHASLFPAFTMPEKDSIMSCPPTEHKKPVKEKIKRTGSLLYRIVKSFDDYDTDYISPNYYNYTAMLQNTNFYQTYRMAAKDEKGNEQALHMAPSPTLKLGPYLGWRWIFLGYTFDIGHPQKATKTTEFNLSLYSSMLGVDLVYIRNTGDFTLRKVTGFEGLEPTAVKGISFSGMDTYTSSINLYYVLNHKHFSYPAAFAQSTVQRKSCGSWILGIRFDKQKIHFDYSLLPDILKDGNDNSAGIIEELKVRKINYRNYSISGGYAYNWVFARNFLLAASFTPALGFKHAEGERVRGDEFWLSMKNLSFDCVTRLGLVWNNTHWFAGTSLVSHLYDYKRDRFTLLNSASYLNVYVGLNFNRKRQYRNR